MLLYLPLGALCAGVALWVASEVQFRVFQPREVQERLFGQQIAPFSALERSSNGCCAMDGSGILEWIYTIPTEQAAALATRCRLPDGAPRPFTNVNSAYFDEHLKQCVVARKYDKDAAEDALAEIAGDTLRVVLFYTDET